MFPKRYASIPIIAKEMGMEKIASRTLVIGLFLTILDKTFKN
jgi:hypothetical protein